MQQSYQGKLLSQQNVFSYHAHTLCNFFNFVVLLQEMCVVIKLFSLLTNPVRALRLLLAKYTIK